MMKKWISALLALVMAFSLAACSGGSDGGSAAKNVDLTAFVDSLAEKYGEDFNCKMDLTDPDLSEMLESMYPGLADIPTKQLIIRQPMMTAVVCEIALVEAENSADVEAVKDIFRARINTQVNGGAWYPESIEGWEHDCRIVENKNYVMLIVWEKCDEVVDQFEDLFR